MAYSVNWISKVITIPVADLTLVSGTRYQLNLEHFLNECRRLEWEQADGLWAPYIIFHDNTRFDFAGANYAAFDEVVNGYTITIGAGATRVDLVGSNNNIADVINNTDIILVSANSAGLTNISEIRSTAFAGRVVVNADTGNAGIAYPIGTLKKPAKFVSDAKTIADAEGVVDFLFKSDILITGIDFSAGYNFAASSPSIFITIDPTADVSGCSFRNMGATGQFDGVNLLERMKAISCTNLSGFAESVSFEGFNSLIGNMELFNCFSGESLNGKPSFNIGGNDIQISNWFKSIEITGATAGATGTIHLTGGRIYFDNTNVDGEVNVRGEPFEIIDNSGPGFTVNDQTESAKVNDLHGQVPRFIFIDTELTINGNGYQQTPFNNFTDAVDYAEANGLFHLKILSDATIDRQLKNFIIIGVGTPTIDCNGQNLDKSEISRCVVTGLYSGRLIIQESQLTGTVNINGFVENCAISSTLIVPDGGSCFMKNCSAFVIGQALPVFDVGGVGGTGNLVVTGFDGGFNLINVNQATDDVKLVMNVSKVIIDSTCSDGVINVGGVTRLIDNSTGSLVIDETLDPAELRDIHIANYNKRTRAGNVITLFEDDKVTIHKQFNTNDNTDDIDPI